MLRMHGRILAAVVVVLMTMATACTDQGAAADKAGGSGERIDLVLANTYGDLNQLPAVAYFVDRVGELSDGQIRVEAVHEWGEFAPDAEQQVVRDVSNGVADLGWVGTRAFDLMGVESFRALTAPMLVDSYALQDAVIESGLTEEMMGGLGEVGVVGLGVLADGLRKPVGVDGPIVGVDDWRGLGFGTFGSEVQADTIRALGATPETVFGHREEAIDSGTIQGFEMGLFIYQRNQMYQIGPYVTANVNLWPQMDILVADPELMDSLTVEQRGWLEQAADDAANRSASLADTEARAIEGACQSGARFADASDQDIAALEQAFAPVYDNLRHDPDTADFIDRIQTMKGSLAAETPAIRAGCTGEAPKRNETEVSGTTSSELNGTYRWVITLAEASSADMVDPEFDYPAVITIALEDGALEGGCFGVDGGTYDIEGDRITFYSIEYGYTMEVTFSADAEGNLTLTPAPNTDPGDAFVCFSQVWTKID